MAYEMASAFCIASRLTIAIQLLSYADVQHSYGGRTVGGRVRRSRRLQPVPGIPARTPARPGAAVVARPLDVLPVRGLRRRAARQPLGPRLRQRTSARPGARQSAPPIVPAAGPARAHPPATARRPGLLAPGRGGPRAAHPADRRRPAGPVPRR